MLEQEPRRGDIRLVTVLLEEQPLKDQRPTLPIVRQKARAAGEIGENCVGLGEDETFVVEKWGAAIGIEPQELRCSAFTLQNVDLNDLVGNPQLRQQQP